jgi:two-component system response regulator HydG
MTDGANGNVLLVEDDSNALKVLSVILRDEGYKVLGCRDAEKALQQVSHFKPDAAITDVKLPGMDGVELLTELRAHCPQLPVIFLTGYGNVESAVHAMSLGAFDYILKPPDFGKLLKVLARAVEQGRMERGSVLPSPDCLSDRECPCIIGSSPGLVELLRMLEKVKDTASNILIAGETGTGKELFARNLHCRSRRKDKPFVAINCAAMPGGLMEAEFFGSEKGAFTGANDRRIGKFEEAEGGTLLLDEISELDLPLQAKLLRVLQEREIERLGSNKKIKVEFRLICSTNKDLAKKVERGEFREDLFYRIHVLEISVPPLRERMSDLPLLVAQFVPEFCKRENKALMVSDEVIQALQKYSWPGNVRQLRNVIERAVILARGRTISLNDLPPEIRPSRMSSARADRLVPLRELEVQAIKDAIIVCNGNKSMAAKLLGISRKAFYSRLKEHPETLR